MTNNQDANKPQVDSPSSSGQTASTDSNSEMKFVYIGPLERRKRDNVEYAAIGECGPHVPGPPGLTPVKSILKKSSSANHHDGKVKFETDP